MRVPIRKGDARTYIKADPRMTQEKFDDLKKKLERWTKVDRPRLAEDVKHLASMGDFSENAGYQLAKGRLRGLNQRILDTENLLNRAEIITANSNSETVQLGNSVTIEYLGKQKTYKILGSTESNPLDGIISYSSPLGSALLFKRRGEIVSLELNGQTVEYKIIDIN